MVRPFGSGGGWQARPKRETACRIHRLSLFFIARNQVLLHAFAGLFMLPRRIFRFPVEDQHSTVMLLRAAAEFPTRIRFVVPLVVSVVILASTASMSMRGIKTAPSFRVWLLTDGIRLWLAAAVFVTLAFTYAF